ncbi:MULTISPECIES: sulfur carrier protein ThiS [unclassified Oleiphilus]|jgi:sulfur carrier protein|uniref:sulfur carrier protein ThiS n=1 Tax=unclassified Oleiphilus TaxID=2631174 RepID=UPI0007C3A2B2|nr:MULTISPECIES: sulfur carrier protein ThiS [unclassified Oleiphilus]KZY44155.1 thiamine biosynthesis protein ThiS [Oleiphilus sp. HI0050]KZY76220.1 thiamine biosynthesis protein ThiS [Oleiphilus sp. HI0068]KZY80011.1 thiamine biosynthesis protein ThiS [Oleiphilus sp. HI0069]KZY87416.1 thiamine biosynthesis protein ThiS [Oleiphilus sp. HI0072]KZZ14725.1 thiamine biosynthesis protein ThiS [Oleiphilus sp. HI0078]KZZ19185.1 thiamine biosynthesis protein ThiS [Oleiphilus sp. HI0081]KZZ32431.1 t
MMINLNGEPYELSTSLKLSELAQHLDLEGKRYAIEVNEEIISRSEHDTYEVKEGDKVEVVVAIGGG